MPAETVVFGTVFMDCKGFAAYRYDPLGRNVGSVRFIHGGVGRNVAVSSGKSVTIKLLGRVPGAHRSTTAPSASRY